MTNTSATGGYLAPSSTSVGYDETFKRQLTQLVRGITGLPDGSVRPRWQTIPPKQPTLGSNWAAVGVTKITPDWGAAIIHHPENEGTDEVQRHETVEVLASFYGPALYETAARLRDGLSVAQNREAMGAAGIALLEAGQLVAAPEFFNQQWIERVDLALVFRREISRIYPVLNVLSAQGALVPDASPQQTFTIPEN